ncbi:hypothetical protein [Pseudoclavibacter sp. AY1F1]|uniref:hypothetical protein n=1 Tax=Pseudoclavibacter sp. AY1F1 TaxID=2080583 RepID=UPI0015E3D43B|nr:hypothetical protein [Pseudoclavibacter sp. AY1F1]
MLERTSPSSEPRLSRRHLVAGAAWAAPVVAIAVAAPARAASTECTPQAAAQITTAWRFNGNITNWTLARSPANAPNVGYSASYQGQGPNSVSNAAVLDADPLAVASTTSLSNTACFGPGTYTFTYTGRAWTTNTRTLTLTGRVVSDAAPGTTLATDTFTTATNTTTFTRTLTVTIPVRTRLRFTYAWGFTAGSASQTGDDIGVGAPAVAKTA